MLLTFIFFFFFFNDTATTEIYTLSLHDALPISIVADDHLARRAQLEEAAEVDAAVAADAHGARAAAARVQERSEEHTSELQSRFDLVCRLLLEKKKKKKKKQIAKCIQAKHNTSI